MAPQSSFLSVLMHFRCKQMPQSLVSHLASSKRKSSYFDSLQSKSSSFWLENMVCERTNQLASAKTLAKSFKFPQLCIVYIWLPILLHAFRQGLSTCPIDMSFRTPCFLTKTNYFLTETNKNIHFYLSDDAQCDTTDCGICLHLKCIKTLILKMKTRAPSRMEHFSKNDKF